MSFDFAGQVAIVTGAGSGMGREGAKLFHAKGWRVGAVDRNDDGLLPDGMGRPLASASGGGRGSLR